MSAGISPTVSVIVPTRNRANLLERALKSIAAQTFTDYEVIVSDDGSDAEVQQRYDTLREMLGPRFIFVPPVAVGALGTGPADTLNRGIRRASGEFLAILADDDEWTAPDYLEVGVRTLRQFDGDLFFANIQGLRAGQVTRADWFDYAPYLKTTLRTAGPPAVYEVSLDQVAKALQHRPIHPNVMIVRTASVHRFGGFLKHAWFVEDWNWAFHAADQSRRIFYRPDVVCNYRFPADDSVCLTATDLYLDLGQLTSAVEARLTCHNRAIRNSARAMEAWLYRTWSARCNEDSRGRDALSWAWQGFCTYPTLGGTACLLKSLLGFLRLWRRRAPVASPRPAG